MKTKLLFTSCLLFCVFSTLATKAQDSTKFTEPSLNGQYNLMLLKSKAYKDYKLISKYRLAAVWQNVSDSLRKEKAKLKSLNTQVANQQKTIANLQAEIAGKQITINTADDKINGIDFLGFNLTKTAYSVIVWSVILILILALVVIITKTSKNKFEAQHRSQLYHEINNEYLAYKAKAGEKERKLARELQDERNLVEEMKKKS